MSIIIRSIHNTTTSNIDLFVPGYDNLKPPVVIAPSATVDLFTVVTGDELEAMQNQLTQLESAGDITIVATVDTTTFNPVGGGGGSGITQLTGDVTAGPGSGSVVSILANVGGSSPANVHSATQQVFEGPSNTLYINQNQPGGFTPDGSILRPFVHIMDAVNQIITNNNGLNYVIIVAPGTYTETITLNNLALNRLAFVTMNVNNGSLSNDALANTSIAGDIVSTSNNANIKSLEFRGFDIQGNINLSGDVNGTTFGQYLILFSSIVLYTTGAVGINLNNVGQVMFENCGTAIQTGVGAITVQNVSFWGCYQTFLNLGAASIVTNGGANKPSGFGNTGVQWSFGNALDNTTIDSGSSLVLRFTRFAGTINNAGTLTSINSVFQGVVTNSGTWNSNADALNATPVNTGTIHNNSTLYSSISYTPAVPGNWASVPSIVSPALDKLAAKLSFKDQTDLTKVLALDLSQESSGVTTTLQPLLTANTTLMIRPTVDATANLITQNATSGQIFIGADASLGGANSGIQYSNATTTNRGQIRLGSYVNATSIAGVTTATSRSGTVGVNAAVVAGQDYSKWTAQAGAATAGSLPISGTFAFKANTVNSLTVTSDFHLQLTNLAGTLGDRFYLTSEGIPQFPALNVAGGYVKTDASGNFSSVTSLAYTPAVPGNWNVQPTTVADALDMIAAKIGPI